MQALALAVVFTLLAGPPGVTTRSTSEANPADNRPSAASPVTFTEAWQAPSSSPPPLTNDDVIRMVRAQLSQAIIITTIEGAGAAFDLSPDGLISLKEAGVPDAVVGAMIRRARPGDTEGPVAAVTPQAPEKSDRLATSRDPAFILQNFKTLYVDAARAQFFDADQMKAALGRDKGFPALRIAIVDDPSVADVVLHVGYTFAWDYPFSLRHQNTSLVLASGKGSGPFSGPAGATSVAHEVVKILTRHRVAPASSGKTKP